MKKQCLTALRTRPGRTRTTPRRGRSFRRTLGYEALESRQLLAANGLLADALLEPADSAGAAAIGEIQDPTQSCDLNIAVRTNDGNYQADKGVQLAVGPASALEARPNTARTCGAMGQGVADSGTFEGQIDAMNGKGIRVVNRLGQTEEFVVTDGTTIVDQQGNPAELHEGQSVNVEWEQVGTRHVATKITVLRLSGAPAESQPMRTAKGITVLCTLAPLGRGRGEETEDAPVIPFAVLGEVSERRPSLPDDSAAADRVFATAGLDEGPFGQDHRDAQVNFTPAPYGKVLGGLIAWIDDS